MSKGTPGAQPTIVVGGTGLGKVVYTVPAGSAGRATSSKSKAKKANDKVTPLKDRRTRLEGRRAAFIIEAFREHLEGIADGTVPLWPDNDVRDHFVVSPIKAVRFAAVFGTIRKADKPDGGSVRLNIVGNSVRTSLGVWADLDRISGEEPTDTVLDFYRAIIATWPGRLWFEGLDMARRRLNGEVEPMAKILGFDLKALKKTAAEELPVPDSWSRLKADGTPKTVAVSIKTGIKKRPKLTPAKSSTPKRRLKVPCGNCKADLTDRKTHEGKRKAKRVRRVKR